MKNWPRYITFKNNTIMVFDRDIPENFLVRSLKKEISHFGIVDVNKWVCYCKGESSMVMDDESTMIMRLTLSV